MFKYLSVPVWLAFANREKNQKGWVSGGGGGDDSGGGDRNGGGSGGGAGVNGGGAGLSPYPLQAFRNSSNSLCLKTH